jgi:hypothetical protein
MTTARHDLVGRLPEVVAAGGEPYHRYALILVD